MAIPQSPSHQSFKPSADTVATVLCHAQVFNPRKWDALVSQADFDQLLKTIEQLFEDLDHSGIAYLLVGGIAMLSYVEGRNTEDIDLIMSRPDLSTLGQMVVAEENRDFARATYQGLQVDLLLTQNSLFQQVQQNYKTEIAWGNRQIPCATPEGLVILKLYALPSLYRQGKFDRAALYETDILQLVYNYEVDLEVVIRVVEPHLIASGGSEIREIARDIEQRRQRMARAQQTLPENPPEL
jgi:hypothetical protein